MMTTVITVKHEHSQSSTMNRQRIVYPFLYYYPRSKNSFSSSPFQDFTVDQKDYNCLQCHFQCRKLESLMMNDKLNDGKMVPRIGMGSYRRGVGMGLTWNGIESA